MWETTRGPHGTIFNYSSQCGEFYIIAIVSFILHETCRFSDVVEDHSSDALVFSAPTIELDLAKKRNLLFFLDVLTTLGNLSCQDVREGIARPCDVSRSPALPPAASQRRDALNATPQHLHRENKKENRFFLCVFVQLRVSGLSSPARQPGCLHGRSQDTIRRKEILERPDIGFFILYRFNFAFFLHPLCVSVVILVLFIRGLSQRSATILRRLTCSFIRLQRNDTHILARISQASWKIVTLW